MTLPGPKPSRFSQSGKLFAILQDGEWHTTQELIRRVPCVVHTRISELRKRGHDIAHETTGQGASGSRYRLLPEAAAPPPQPEAVDALPSSASTASPQLALEVT